MTRRIILEIAAEATTCGECKYACSAKDVMCPFTDALLYYHSPRLPECIAAEQVAQPKRMAGRKRKCGACGRLTRVTTAGCDYCDVEDK